MQNDKSIKQATIIKIEFWYISSQGKELNITDEFEYTQYLHSHPSSF